MATKTDLDDQSKPNIASSSNTVIIPTKFEFDTLQNVELATGFRAPPTSPCNTFVGVGGTTMTSLMSKLQMENCTLPHITPQELEMQNELLIKQRKRGRKSAPHVATLFSSPSRSKDDESEHADSSFATSSSTSIPSSSSFFGGGQGNYPPPNSPENSISSSMIDQNNSMLANFSCNPIGDQEEQQTCTSSYSSIAERATQLSQLKTQLHLTHKLEQIRRTSDSTAGIE
ncbi:uncharacterized protein FA14DRAFT_152954 [Meira miltonrushii]|uniref:Uncharacterized protein n=1 Tax=Meira miltonrushii TaxID=1280837 RepID=A0A316VIU4_9BASI|nr:uncharacterized protein FA14DRAFT_152954 [Meira miltonrushii]PWN37587.1 hypothetical protein FA14DRAFT_152954 [Meira miltonrushii]